MQQSGPPQIAALTSTRGLAAWWVALYHFREYLPLAWDGPVFRVIDSGYYAVDLFFVLSGFVLQINYAGRMVPVPTRRALRGFAVARFARVYPLHFVMLMVYLLIPAAILLFSQAGQLGPRFAPEYFLLSLLLIQNWGFTDQVAWNVPAWSISTEFAAYLLFPLAAMLTMRLRRAAVAGALLIALALGLAWLFWVTGRRNLTIDIAGWGLVRCLLEFGMGMCVGRIYQLRGAPGVAWQVALLGAAAGLAVLAAVGGIPDYVLVPAAMAFLVLALTCPSGPLAHVLGWRWLLYLGRISYATYLVHYFLREVIKFAMPVSVGPSIGASVTFVVATLTASVILYHFVELPARIALRGQAAGERARAGRGDGAAAGAWVAGRGRSEEERGA